MFGIDGVPFLATSYGDALKLWKASRKPLDDRLAKQGIKVLFSVPWPPQGIYSKRPLNSVADMKGLKWRAYSPATSRIAELVGAQPLSIQAAEVPQALATGVMDSMMSSGATGYDSKIFEHVKNFYDTQAWLPKNAVLVNQKAFDALDKADPGRRPQGCRRCRGARLEALRGEDRLVSRAAQEERHERRRAERRPQGRAEEGR